MSIQPLFGSSQILTAQTRLSEADAAKVASLDLAGPEIHLTLKGDTVFITKSNPDFNPAIPDRDATIGLATEEKPVTASELKMLLPLVRNLPDFQKLLTTFLTLKEGALQSIKAQVESLFKTQEETQAFVDLSEGLTQ